MVKQFLKLPSPYLSHIETVITVSASETDNPKITPTLQQLARCVEESDGWILDLFQALFYIPHTSTSVNFHMCKLV